MNDTVTIITSATNSQIVKSFGGADYQQLKFGPGSEFQQADCWYQFSFSMGIKAGIRVHLWYWLERPCSG